MASESAAVPAGTLIEGKYRVERRIGEGGMGYVVAARHETLDDTFAIKIMASGSDETLRKRFLGEARAAARITSRHIVKVFDVGEMPDGAGYMVMELLEGEDLDRKIRRDGPLRCGEAVGYVLEACEALAEAHGLGIVHRDVKPGNLFLCEKEGERPIVKLLDFGISKDAVMDGNRITKLTQTGSVLGSPMFMAPEQLVSSSDVDARADIWSLGVTLFELLTGEAVFEGKTATDLYTAILRLEPRSLTALMPNLAPDLERVIERCLEKDPYDRYDTVAELAEALRPFAPGHARISLKRITANVAPIAETMVGEHLVETHKAEPLLPTLQETLVPLVRRVDPQPAPPAAPTRRSPLVDAPTTVMERERPPPERSAVKAVTTPSWQPVASVPKPPNATRPTGKWVRRGPLLVLVVLAVAVLAAGAYRYAAYADSTGGKEKPRKNKAGRDKTGRNKATKSRDKSKSSSKRRTGSGASSAKNDASLAAADRTQVEAWLNAGGIALASRDDDVALKRSDEVLKRLAERGFVLNEDDSAFAARAKALEGDVVLAQALERRELGEMMARVNDALPPYSDALRWDTTGTACIHARYFDALKKAGQRYEELGTDNSKVAAFSMWKGIVITRESMAQQGIDERADWSSACRKRIEALTAEAEQNSDRLNPL